MLKAGRELFACAQLTLQPICYRQWFGHVLYELALCLAGCHVSCVIAAARLCRNDLDAGLECLGRDGDT